MVIDQKNIYVDYAKDDTLSYKISRRRFSDGDRLLFDEPYRYAQLPLIAADHPAAIINPVGLDYKAGRYEVARYSLVIPVPHSQLSSGSVFRSLDGNLRSSSFKSKISFELCEARQSNQHITLASGFKIEDLPLIEATVREYLQDKISVGYQLKGPFVGSKNFGRMYFPAYPAVQDGVDVYAQLQNAIGVNLSGFYAMGYYNLNDELSSNETAELQDIIDAFGNEIVFEAHPDEFWITATNDDLVLSGRILAIIETEKGRARSGTLTNESSLIPKDLM